MRQSQLGIARTRPRSKLAQTLEERHHAMVEAATLQ
jgi:hypothetical protein